jgi:hypothetical protein
MSNSIKLKQVQMPDEANILNGIFAILPALEDGRQENIKDLITRCSRRVISWLLHPRHSFTKRQRARLNASLPVTLDHYSAYSFKEHVIWTNDTKTTSCSQPGHRRAKEGL